MTTEKAVIIIVVTAIIIVLAYVFRLGRFGKRTKAAPADESQQGKSV